MSSYRKDLAKLAKKYGFKIIGYRNNGHILLGNGDRTLTAAYSPRSPFSALRHTQRKLEEMLS